MKIGLTNEEVMLLKKIANRCGKTVDIDSKNIIHVPEAYKLLGTLYSKIESIPSFLVRSQVNKFSEYLELFNIR